VPHGKQNGVSPSPESRVTISPFVSISSEPITSSELAEERPSENGGRSGKRRGWGEQPVQTELLPGQTYRGPPNLDPSAVSCAQRLPLTSRRCTPTLTVKDGKAPIEGGKCGVPGCVALESVLTGQVDHDDYKIGEMRGGGGGG